MKSISDRHKKGINGFVPTTGIHYQWGVLFSIFFSIVQAYRQKYRTAEPNEKFLAVCIFLLCGRYCLPCVHYCNDVLFSVYFYEQTCEDQKSIKLFLMCWNDTIKNTTTFTERDHTASQETKGKTITLQIAWITKPRYPLSTGRSFVTLPSCTVSRNNAMDEGHWQKIFFTTKINCISLLNISCPPNINLATWTDQLRIKAIYQHRYCPSSNTVLRETKNNGSPYNDTI